MRPQCPLVRSLFLFSLCLFSSLALPLVGPNSNQVRGGGGREQLLFAAPAARLSGKLNLSRRPRLWRSSHEGTKDSIERPSDVDDSIADASAVAVAHAKVNGNAVTTGAPLARTHQSDGLSGADVQLRIPTASSFPSFSEPPAAVSSSLPLTISYAPLSSLAPSPPSVSSRPSLSSLFSAYSTLLDSHPLPTKAVTTALIAALGDLAAQFLSPHNSPFSLRRLGCIFLDGLVLSGPLMAVSYNRLNAAFEPAASKPTTDPRTTDPNPPTDSTDSTDSTASLANTVAAVKMLLVSSLLLDPLFILELMTSTYVLEGLPLSLLPSHLLSDFLPTLKASLSAGLLIAPLDFCVFRLLPARYRVLGMNVIDLAWTAVVSSGAHRNRVLLA